MSKRLVYLLLISLFVYFVAVRFNDGKTLVEILSKAKWGFIFLAVCLQFLHYIVHSYLFQRSLSLYGTKWKFRKILRLVLASLSINVFAPLAPFPGSALFIKEGRREDIPALNIVASTFLVVLFDYLALCPLLALSIYFQIFNKGIFVYEVLGIIVFSIIILSLIVILLFGILSPKILNTLFLIVEKVINKFHFLFKRRDFFIKGWSASRALQFIELSKKLLSSTGKKQNLFLISFSQHMVDLTTLFLLFIAFGYVPTLPILMIGYSLMLMFWIVTPTPQGVGFVEVITPAIFNSMGVKMETATLVVLAYRGLNLWLPLVIGFTILPTLFKGNPEDN